MAAACCEYRAITVSTVLGAAGTGHLHPIRPPTARSLLRAGSTIANPRCICDPETALGWPSGGSRLPKTLGPYRLGAVEASIR